MCEKVLRLEEDKGPGSIIYIILSKLITKVRCIQFRKEHEYLF